jgi:hypothetical protein
MDPINLELRVGRLPPAAAANPGELSATQIDGNFTNLRTACEQLDAEKLPSSAAAPLGASASAPIDSDEIIVIIGGVPLRATKSQLFAAATAAIASLSTRVSVLEGAAPVAPADFTVGQWTVASTGVSGAISINITALPSNGGSAITTLQYRIGTGSAVDLVGTGTGARTITGLVDGVAVNVQIRAVNAVSAGPWSDTKSVTPSVAAVAPAAFTAGDWTAAATAVSGEISFNLTTLPSNGGSAITALQYRVGAGAAIAFTGTATGVRVVTAGLTAGVAVDLQVRAVNSVGAGAWSDVKNRTPFSAGGSIVPVGVGTTYTNFSALTAHTGIAVPAGLAVGDMLILTLGELGVSVISSIVTNTGQNLVSRVSQVGSVWSVVITGSVPTSLTVNLSAAEELRAKSIAVRGVTQVAGTTNVDAPGTPRATMQYASDVANAFVVMLYVSGPLTVTDAVFNGADNELLLEKFNFNPVGVITGIHNGPTGTRDIGITWSGADLGGRFISVAFKA